MLMNPSNEWHQFNPGENLVKLAVVELYVKLLSKTLASMIPQ